MSNGEHIADKQFWGPWATAGFGILVLLLFLVIQVLVMALFVAVRLVENPEQDTSRLVEMVSANGTVFGVSTCATAIFCTGLILGIIFLRRKASVSNYLALRPVTLKTLGSLLGMTIGFILCTDLVTTFLDRPVVPHFMLEMYKSGGVFFWVGMVLAAPAFEEVFFRGFLLQGFWRSRLGMTGAVVLTSIIWAAIHLQYDWYGLIVIFLFGLILGIVRIKTRSLWSVLFMHVVVNLTAMVEATFYV